MADEEPKKEEPTEATEDAPAAAKVTKKPDKQVFQKNVDEVQAEINKLTSEMERIQKKADEHRGKKGAKGPVAEARQFMRTLREKKNVVMEARKDLFDRRDLFKAGMAQMKEQASSMKGNMKFSNVDDINKQLKKLEQEHSTTTMTLNQEKELIKEIETLKSMKKLIAPLSANNAKMAEGKEASKDLGEQIKEQNQKLAAINDEIEAQKTVLDKLNEKEGNKKDVFPQLMKEKDEVKKNIDAEYDKIRTLRTEWRENNNIWFEYSKILRAKKQKEWEAEQASRQEEWEAKQAELEAEEAKKEPWEAEKKLCDFLVEYLERVGAKDEVKEEVKKETQHLEGMTVFSKRDAEDDDLMAMFGGGGKKSKGAKKNKKKKAAVIKHDIDTLQTFAMVSLTPPNTGDDISKSLQEVKDKKAWYYTQPRPDPKAKKEAAAAGGKPKKSGGNKKQSLPDFESFPELGGGAAPAKKAAPAAAAPAPAAAAPAPAAKAAPAPAAAAPADSGAAYVYHGKDIPEDKITYSDDMILGSKLPEMNALDWLQDGDTAKDAVSKGKYIALVFWGKYAKGDYKLVCHFSDLATKYPDICVIGIACDAEKEDAEKLFTKIGKAMPEQGIDNFTLNFPSAYDPGKKFNGALKRAAMVGSIGPGYCLLVDKVGTIKWKEQFTSSYFLANGQFEEQVRRITEGEKLMDNGPRPEGDGDEEEEISVEVGGDEFDAFADGDGDDY